MKNRLLSLTVAGVFLFSALAFGANQKERSLTTTNNSRYRVLTPATKGDVALHNISKKQDNNSRSMLPFKSQHQQSSDHILMNPAQAQSTLWTLQHTDGVSEYYLGSGAAGDTFAVVFTPAAPCSVKYVDMSWFSSGNFTAFAANYSADAQAEYPGGLTTDAEDDMVLPRPIGELLAPYTPGSVANAGTEFGDRMPADIGNFKVGNETTFETEPFLIGFVKGGETPQPLADGDQAPNTYTWFGGPATDNQWESYNSDVDVNMRVIVTYPWGAPIAFTVNQLPNTYNTSGPFMARFNLFDDVDQDGTAITSADSITFHATDGTNTITVDQADFVEYDVESSGNGWYEAEISGLDFSVGNQITYWLDATDNQDLYSVSNAKSFTVMKPGHPDADVLVIMDNGIDRSSVYFDVLNENGVVYETWNADPGANNGIDSSVINYGWNNIILFGWGAGSLPAVQGEEDPGYATFLDNGGNLFYSDQDYFYAHGLDETGTFSPGDFAYDYLGLGEYTNDPTQEPPNDSKPKADSVFTGVGGVASSITTYSLEGGFDIWDIHGNDWGDYVSPSGSAMTLFIGSNDGQNYGVQNTTSAGGTTVYSSFMAEANVDTTAEGVIVPGAEFTALMNAVLGDEFGVASPPQITNFSGRTTSTYDDGPFTISADIADFNGDAITATVKYSLDMGATWNDAAMTDDGSGHYSADIPAQTSETYVHYYIQAEDAGGLMETYPNANQPVLWFWTGNADNEVLLVDDMGGYFGYFGRYYNQVLGDTVDMYSIPDYGVPDETVFNTSAHTTIFWASDFAGATTVQDSSDGNILQNFLDAGGNLVFASDEWVGAIHGWNGYVELGAGQFAYDYLGVNMVESDGSDIAYVEGLTGNALTDGIARDSLTIPIGQANYTDRTVPVGEYTDESDFTMYTGVFNNNGTYKTVFVPFIFGAIDSTSRQMLVNKAMAWFADDGAATGAMGMFGPVQNGPVAVADEGPAQPTQFALNQNYPNPFNPTTNISYSIPEKSHVTLTVYNMLGQRVATLVNEQKTAGNYTVNFSANQNSSQLASGMYFYRLQTDQFTQVKKMLLMK